MTATTLTDDDIFTLIGHAEYLKMQGGIDMPGYFFDLAGRIATAIGNDAMRQRCEELNLIPKSGNQIPKTKTGSSDDAKAR